MYGNEGSRYTFNWLMSNAPSYHPRKIVFESVADKDRYFLRHRDFFKHVNYCLNGLTLVF